MGEFSHDLPGTRLDGDARELLVRPIDDEEIWSAVRSLPTDKAPGFDGFAASFYRFYWDIIKAEVKAAVKHFFATGRMPLSWKRTVICLIPKCAGAERIRDFRPISLCSFPYKICSKVLANRLKVLLPYIVGREQGAFIAGRSISDNIFIATELYHSVTVARYPLSSPDLMMLKRRYGEGI